MDGINKNSMLDFVSPNRLGSPDLSLVPRRMPKLDKVKMRNPSAEVRDGGANRRLHPQCVNDRFSSALALSISIPQACQRRNKTAAFSPVL